MKNILLLTIMFVLNSCVIIKFYSGNPNETYYLNSTTINTFQHTDTLKVVRNGNIIIKDTLGHEYLINGKKLW